MNSTLAAFRLSLDRRIQWVLETYLREAIDGLNARIAVDQRIPYVQTTHVGVDSVVLERDRNPIDLYPALCVYEQSSRATPAGFAGANDDVISFGVSSLVTDDTANVAWASQKAKLLALLAAETLEAHLPEMPGIASPQGSVYRVDVSSTNGPRGGPLRSTDLYLATYVVQVTVYVRFQYGYDPAIFDTTNNPPPTTSAVFEAAPLVGLGITAGAGVGNLTLGNVVALTAPAGTLEIRLTELADGTPITGWPAGSVALLTPTSTGPTQALTPVGATVALPPLVSGEQYSLTLVHPTFGTFGTYRLTVTESP